MFGELHARALRENAELKLRVTDLETALRRLQCDVGVSVEAHDIIAKVIGTPQRPIGVTPSDDTARLDYLQRTGSTLQILPGTARGARFRFRVGGLHAAVSDDLRAAIDTASGVEGRTNG